uniref:Uncharacterized protein n=1 Tax=Arundo donax TaxID=35708 RepID=A0A0A9CE00_ARUDO
MVLTARVAIRISTRIERTRNSQSLGRASHRELSARSREK